MTHQQLRDKIAQNLRIWRRVFRENPYPQRDTEAWRRGIVKGLRTFARDCTRPERWEARYRLQETV